MSDRSVRIGAALTLAVLAAGCGQKGALYLPDRAGSVINRPGETVPPRTSASTPAPSSATPGSKQRDDGSGNTDESPKH